MNTLLTLSGESALVPALDDGTPHLSMLTQTAAEILHCPPRHIALADMGNGAFMAIANPCRTHITFMPLEEWINRFGDGYVQCYFTPMDSDLQRVNHATFTCLLEIDDLLSVPFHFIYYRGQFTRIRTSELELICLSKWEHSYVDDDDVDDYDAIAIETPETRWFDSLETCLRADLRIDEYDTEKRWLSAGHSAELVMEPAIDECLSQSSSRFLHIILMNELWQLAVGLTLPPPAQFWIQQRFETLREREADIHDLFAFPYTGRYNA